MHIIEGISNGEAILRVYLEKGINITDLANMLNITESELHRYLWRVELTEKDYFIKMLESATDSNLSNFMMKKELPTIEMPNTCPHCNEKIFEESNRFRMSGCLKVNGQSHKVCAYGDMLNVLHDCVLKSYANQDEINIHGTLEIDNTIYEIKSIEDLKDIIALL